MTQPAVSIIIRAFNEEKYISLLLDALATQTRRDFETVVVDSGSTDRTRTIARERADKLIRISGHDFTFGHSLNEGIKAASGDIIVIVSAHAVPVSAEWLYNLTTPFSEQKIAMVYGCQRGWKTSKFSEARDLKRMFGERRFFMKPPDYFANNANSAIRKELWEKHPFDETLPGLEDIAWAKYWADRDYMILYEPSATVYHIHEETWRQVRRRYYREAVASHWLGLKGRRHALEAVANEAGWLVGDVIHNICALGRDGASLQRVGEIALFRVNKALGTVKGLFDGAVMKSPARREAMYFDYHAKAVVIHKPHHASLENIAIPPLKPGEVLVRVAYEAVCATDIEIYNGSLGYYQRGTAHYPIVPGHEFSGQVVEVGANVQHVSDGDAVVVECIQSCGVCPECRRGNHIGCPERTEIGVIGRNGGYSEYVIVPGRFVHTLPRDYDMRAACLCEPLAVVLKGIRRLQRTWTLGAVPKRCAVVGAGPLGNLCAQVLHRQGHEVQVYDRAANRLACLDAMGIATTTDMQAIANADACVEATGDPDALHAMLLLSRAGASLLLLGLPYAHREFTFESIVAYDKIIVGSVGSSSEDFEEAIALLPALNPQPFLQCIMPLQQFKSAWQMQGKKNYLKIILKVSDD